MKEAIQKKVDRIFKEAGKWDFMTNEKELRESVVKFYNATLHHRTMDEWTEFIESLLHSHTQEVVEKAQEAIDQERQFVMNVLDGIDIADAQMQNEGGGTKAIRFALSSRVKPNLLALLKEDNNK